MEQKYKQYSYIIVKQPIGVFYLASIPVCDLVSMVEIVRRSDTKKIGVQRPLSENRLKEISEYCKRVDATFPTSIIVNVHDVSKFIINENDKTLRIEEGIIGSVIDGQHRLEGLKQADILLDFELPVVFMLQLDVEDQAYIFSTINSKQKSVSASVIYDLFEVAKGRSPQKVCHEIARALNSNPNSPFYNNLKILGKKERDQDIATISQGTFVEYLLLCILTSAEKKTFSFKDDLVLSYNERYPLRTYYINEEDSVILKIMMNCFEALKEVFSQEWEEREKSILWKTTGYGGVMKALSRLVLNGQAEKNLRKDYFVRIFTSFKNGLGNDGLKKYKAGESEQKRLADDICLSNDLSI